MENHNPQNEDDKSMEAIRDLIFGQKSREIGDEIKDMERRLQSSISEIEQRLNNRFDSLEQYVKGEIGSAQEQFSAGRSESERKADEAGQRVKSLGETLNDRFVKVEDAMTKIETEGRHQMFERTKALSDEIAESSRRINEKVDNELNSLRNTTTRKNELSELFLDLGMRMQPKDDDHNQHG